MSREMMLNTKLDPKTRESWTQKHTNTAQALNQILRDRQLKDWEKRLRELEVRGLLPRGTTRRLGTVLAPPTNEATDVSREPEQEKLPDQGGSV